jgi:RNA polymerase sigma factor (sigma-70 family)
MATDDDRRISDFVTRERPRLLRFIRRRVADPRDAEDILQDVFRQLVEANRMLMPIDHVTAWLFRVARSRIIDRFRTRRREEQHLGDLLPSPDAGPDALYARRILLEAIEVAIDELPPEQREVFVAHEFEGRTFKEMSERSGESVNTLMTRKHYAVLHLRGRLQRLYDELVKA